MFGCGGVGGGDFYMAENFDAEVVGIDLSINMISLAISFIINGGNILEWPMTLVKRVWKGFLVD